MDAGQNDDLQQAMTALAAGDRSAFRRVFSILWPRLRRYCENRLGDPALAQDAAQSALMKLMLHAGDFRSERDALAWAIGFAAHECLSARKRLLRLREDLDAPGLLKLAAAQPSPEDAAIHGDLQAAGAQLLAAVRPVDRATLSLAFAGERPAANPAFRKRLQRALERLRTSWRNLHGSDE